MSETLDVKTAQSLAVAYLPVAQLVRYGRNARTHSPVQIEQISRSIQEFGFTNPILLDESVQIIAGHGRLAAAESLGMAEVPTITLRGLTPTQCRALVLADNQLALNAGWDMDLLKLEITDLQIEGFDVTLLGFGDSLTDILDPAVQPGKDPDEVPPVPETPHSKLGDVWVCGSHKVMCGDSLKSTAWSRLMGFELADLCVTDPPYNVAYTSKLAGSIKNDDMSDGKFREFLTGAFTRLYEVMKPGASIYVYHSDTEGYNFRGAFKEAGFHMSGCLIWKKNSLVLGRSPYQWIHEPCLFGFKKGAAHRFFGGRKQVTVTEFGDPFVQREDGTWAVEVAGQTLIVTGDVKVEALEQSVIYCDKPKRSGEHPTMKPTQLLVKNIRNSGRLNDIIVDAFGGSGSTMIAADMIGLCARTMELDEKYVDVMAQRYFEWTGRIPVHAETGAEFPVNKEKARLAKK